MAEVARGTYKKRVCLMAVMSLGAAPVHDRVFALNIESMTLTTAAAGGSSVAEET